MSAFGKLLRKLRRNADLTLLDLANSADLSVTYVSQIENGDRNPPSESILKIWARQVGAEERFEELRDLANNAITTVQVKLEGRSQEERELVLALARNDPNYIDPDLIRRFVEALEKKRGSKQ